MALYFDTNSGSFLSESDLLTEWREGADSRECEVSFAEWIKDSSLASNGTLMEVSLDQVGFCLNCGESVLRIERPMDNESCDWHYPN